MHGFNGIPVRELTSCAAIYGIAAELIQENMKNQKDKDFRIGTCMAFGHIQDAVRDAFYADRITWSKRCELQRKVDHAKHSFTLLYKSDGYSRTGDYVYWMGTRSDMGQKRRITALLMAASVVQD